MSAIVADTHGIVWYLGASPNLSPAADAAMNQAEVNGDAIYIASITVVEVVYLVEKGRLPLIALTSLLQAIQSPFSSVAVVALDYDVAYTMQRVPRSVVPDMPDRIIAATALYLNLPLVTRDHKIQAAQIVTIW